VVGSDFHITLRRQERYQIPNLGDEERLVLDNLIREAGLWDRYSSLDRYALERAIRTGQIDPGLMEKLSGLVKKETLISLYPGKNEGPSD